VERFLRLANQNDGITADFAHTRRHDNDGLRTSVAIAAGFCASQPIRPQMQRPYVQYKYAGYGATVLAVSVSIMAFIVMSRELEALKVAVSGLTTIGVLWILQFRAQPHLLCAVNELALAGFRSHS
jgi:hypothetical protein